MRAVTLVSLIVVCFGGIMNACHGPSSPAKDAGRSLSSTSVEFEEGTVRYSVGGKPFASHFIAPGGRLRAGLLFGPDWYGVYDYPISEARRWARLGFAVLVVDVYGEGVRPSNDEEAGRLFGQLHTDRRALRERMSAAHRELVSRLPSGTKISAYGFSMGGMEVLELARSGADLSGAVVLSGVLDHPGPGDAAQIRPSLLILHGTQDQFAPVEQVVTLTKELDAARRPFRLQLFGGAAHAFTNPKFAGATEGPLRYSARDAAVADGAAFEFLTTLHP
jgi:dienelactone hydrolase